jgi:PleD family two-component response regulator
MLSSVRLSPFQVKVPLIKSILIVDDSQTIRTAVRNFLQEQTEFRFAAKRWMDSMRWKRCSISVRT